MAMKPSAPLKTTVPNINRGTVSDAFSDTVKDALACGEDINSAWFIGLVNEIGLCCIGIYLFYIAHNSRHSLYPVKVVHKIRLSGIVIIHRVQQVMVTYIGCAVGISIVQWIKPSAGRRA